MTAIAALTLADGQASPVNHTFTPVNVDNNVARWDDKVTGTPIAYPRITYSLRQPTKANKAYKASFRVVVPTTEVVAPSTLPTKVYDNFANIEFVFSDRSTLAERKNLLAYVKNLLANAVATSAIHDAESVWG